MLAARMTSSVRPASSAPLEPCPPHGRVIGPGTLATVEVIGGLVESTGPRRQVREREPHAVVIRRGLFRPFDLLADPCDRITVVIDGPEQPKVLATDPSALDLPTQEPPIVIVATGQPVQASEQPSCLIAGFSRARGSRAPSQRSATA